MKEKIDIFFRKAFPWLMVASAIVCIITDDFAKAAYFIAIYAFFMIGNALDNINNTIGVIWHVLYYFPKGQIKKQEDNNATTSKTTDTNGHSAD